MNAGKHKNPEEATRMQVTLTPNSSVKSSLTVDTNPGFYFPGCRKDANCKCEICIASINATLDLKITHRSSFTKSYPPRAFISRSPVSFSSLSADISTPKSTARTKGVPISPIINPTERVCSRKKKDSVYGVFLLRIFCCLVLILGMEYGVSWIVSGFVRARLSPDLVKNLGLNSRGFQSLNGGFEFLKNELKGLVNGDVSSCSSVDHSLWKINQDGQLLHSRCVLYKSMAEEVSIWGWPLQTSGLIATQCCPKSFTVLTGRVREWSNRDVGYLVRGADNSSWTQVKWSSNVVQFDPNTWILEYRRSVFVENLKMVSTAVEFLRFRLRSRFEKMKQEFWLASGFGDRYSVSRRGSFAAPT